MEGGGTQGCKVEANGSIMKQPVKHSGATFVKLYASWRVFGIEALGNEKHATRV